ncbi:hypothetical protein AMAG_00146 [Allomyces macrogynus ATCC 38327]|uniref:Uncharacterized protein n=1 Tax=Allomyces macrogynus (strain ATCC 38327) TaxID=578462 RepID=A0A0L0RV29_ALLM3|nr:hypothetical protein AMAG_00146 [Allomyces macrogynus ATCC 38327]|eukprot:KNE54148.1 hypothetical protein AMAG_00146 [Allomyces macrogynus ATCC 38327]
MHATLTFLLWTLLSALFTIMVATTAVTHPPVPPPFPHPGTFRIHHPPSSCPPLLPASTLCETATWYLHLYPEQQFTVSRTRDPHKWEVAGVWDAIKPPASLVLEMSNGDVRVWEVVGDAAEGRVRVEERVGWDGVGREGQARVGKHEVMELERVV